MANESTANQLAAIIGESVQGQVVSTQYLQKYPQFQQHPYYYQTYTCNAEHVYDLDEQLLLRAIHKDPSLKDKTLKFVLKELLASLG